MQWAATMGYGYYDRYDGSSEDSCDCCGGDGCEECDDQFEEQLVQCRGITQRGTRCQITSDSVHGQRNKFADAAVPLTCGSHYCTFHTEQEYESDECHPLPLYGLLYDFISKSTESIVTPENV